MNFAQLDFRQLRIKHILYKSRVRSVLYGGTYDEDFFIGGGPVIEWINTVIVAKYERNSEINEMVSVQEEINKLALQLFGLYDSGEIEEARVGLRVIEQSSERFLTLLDSLERKYS